MYTSKIKNTIRNQDIFGFPVHLNFNRNGNTSNTFLGGCLSILAYISLILVLGQKFNGLIMHSNDTIQQDTSLADLNEIG